MLSNSEVKPTTYSKLLNNSKYFASLASAAAASFTEKSQHTTDWAETEDTENKKNIKKKHFYLGEKNAALNFETMVDSFRRYTAKGGVRAEGGLNSINK